MKLALLSDIHANIQALEACLAHARAQGVTRFAFLGDLVGYGANPGAVIDTVRAMVADGALAIKGNHDQMAVTPPGDARTVGDVTATWTHLQLDDGQRKFLDTLPMMLQEQTLLLVHASVDAPELWRYVYDERAASASLDAAHAMGTVRYVFGGHVHMQTMYYRGSGTGLMKFAPTPGVGIPVPRHRYWLVTVGSVGQPRDGQAQAMYSIMDSDKSTLTFERVAYDHHAAAQAIRHAGLPAFFADRLEIGR